MHRVRQVLESLSKSAFQKAAASSIIDVSGRNYFISSSFEQKCVGYEHRTFQAQGEGRAIPSWLTAIATTTRIRLRTPIIRRTLTTASTATMLMMPRKAA